MNKLSRLKKHEKIRRKQPNGWNGKNSAVFAGSGRFTKSISKRAKAP